MTAADFQVLKAEPAGYSPALRALWYAARGAWDEAHELVQNEGSREAAWVHAYLHRQEGDLSNARYWYTRAGQPEFRGELAKEWMETTKTLLMKGL